MSLRIDSSLGTVFLALATTAVLLGGCASSSPTHPPFNPGHPDGWQRSDLEWETKRAVSWRLVTPHGMRTPAAAALKAETYLYTRKTPFTLESFHTSASEREGQLCPGSTSVVLSEAENQLLYEASAPFESKCWGYQLVRLQQGKEMMHALIVYAHRRPSESDREVWLQIVSQATFVPYEQ